jgi:hypothetical protein
MPFPCRARFSTGLISSCHSNTRSEFYMEIDMVNHAAGSLSPHLAAYESPFLLSLTKRVIPKDPYVMTWEAAKPKVEGNDFDSSSSSVPSPGTTFYPQSLSVVKWLDSGRFLQAREKSDASDNDRARRRCDPAFLRGGILPCQASTVSTRADIVSTNSRAKKHASSD